MKIINSLRSVWFLLAVSGLSASLSSCKRTSPGGDHGESQTASITWVMASDLQLIGNPQLFEIVVEFSNGAASIRKGGDLPSPGQTITVTGLPSDPAATIRGALYKNDLDNSQKTHSCFVEQTVSLIAGQNTSAEMVCMAVTDPSASPIRVLLKVAKLNLTVREQDGASILANRDFSQPSLFTITDRSGRRITLKQDAASLRVFVYGAVNYLVENKASEPWPLVQLLQGATLTLDAISGENFAAFPEQATLTLAGSPLLYERLPGDFAVALPIALANTSGTVAIDGQLFEEQPNSEITVVSYNVENFFDQVDDERSSHYGDYRITPNENGYSSNYGEPVDFEGAPISFSAVKAAGIRRALVGIDPAGPEIVGLLEVESQGSMDLLLAAVRDLGYQSAIFSEVTPDMTPTAIGMGLLTKLPVLSSSILKVPSPNVPNPEVSRPILKVTLDVSGHPLVVYVNHWKSKSGPESQRILYAETLQADIEAMQASQAKFDFIVLGDLNSEYNESTIILSGHNDTGGMTGINDTLAAQGDEVLVIQGGNPKLKDNLHYDLNRSARQTAYHEGFGWSSLDHMIIGSGLFDQRGLTYIPNSFEAATFAMPRMKFLFNPDGTTNRWHMVKESANRTKHEVGGFSDHLPIFARFRVPGIQRDQAIWVSNAGHPDVTDSRP